jgi:hypothetical protein
MVQEPKDSKAICPAEIRTLPIGAIAGQNITEPKEKPPKEGVFPLRSFIGANHETLQVTTAASAFRLHP